jgi:hypothetical protein
MNLATNYSGSGALLATDDLVFNGTGSAVAIITADLTVKSVTVSGTASITTNGFRLTVSSGTGIVCSGSGTITATGASTNWTISGTTGAISLASGPTYVFGAANFAWNISATTVTITLGISVSIQGMYTTGAGGTITWDIGANTLSLASGGGAY